MTAIAISDEAYSAVEGYVYQQRTTRKDIVEKMIRFAEEHKESFLAEMF